MGSKNVKSILKAHLVWMMAFCFLLFGCNSKQLPTKTYKGPNYELTVSPKQKAVLILFPCYGCGITYTKNEALFLKKMPEDGITTLLFNTNQKLYLSSDEKDIITSNINRALDSAGVKKKNIYIGGFSSGGNVTMLIANHLLKTKDPSMPKGIFVVDSPIDLERLYWGCEKDIKKNASEISYNEAVMVVELLGEKLGNPSTNPQNYKLASPYVASSNTVDNIDLLKSIKTRFYTEPAPEWQQKERNRAYEETNAWMLEAVVKSLKSVGAKKCELIQTENKGYLSCGTRHPHSWSIVDREGLMAWILEK